MVVDGAGYYQTVAANEPDAVPATVVLIGLGVGALMPPADNKNSRRRQPTVR
jgi:hypothetical protein